MRCAAFFAALICCMPLLAHAAAKREGKPELTERVTAVKADGTLQLSSSGVAVVQNLLWPDAALAESWLADHMLQQNLTFKLDDEDRYGRMQITSDAAENALRAGAAIIYASEGKIPKSWHEAEDAARAAKRGIWGKSGFVIAAANTADHIGEFHAIEGTITRTYEAKSATYLNFGEDWHSDFSVTIPARSRRGFASTLERIGTGTRVLVRGYIYEENGPMITLTRPNNLEIE